MHLYLYIDESGAFDEGLSGARSSVVGGICAGFSSQQWEVQHRRHLQEFNSNQHLTCRLAYPDHYHCGEFLASKISSPSNLKAKDREGFALSVLDNVLVNSLFGVVSRNLGKRFEYSPQATYVMNLVAVLRHAFSKIARLDSTVSAVTAVIAQRTIKETTQTTSITSYMTALLSFVTDQLMIGEGPGVALAKSMQRDGSLTLTSGIATRDAGLIGADFVCCLARYNKKPASGAVVDVCHPEEKLLLGDYRSSYFSKAQELLDHRYYGSYLEFICRFFPFRDGIPDIGKLKKALEAEQDANTLERELPSLLAVIHSLAKQRSEVPHALSSAIYAAECLVGVAEKQLPKSERESLWINLAIQALSELVSCHNHTGAIGPQEAAESALSAMLEKNKKNTGLDAMQRKTLLLDVRNRNVNLLFNDYRFEDAYTLAEELANERHEMTGDDEPDTVMGKILGSQGQACAFMAHSEPDWTAEAEKLFHKSFEHFASRSIQEQMSRNFLVTARWQGGSYLEALDAMRPLQGNARSSTIDLTDALLSRLVAPQQAMRAYEVVNALRLLAGLGPWTVEGLRDTCIGLERIACTVGTDHPYEQWWKWLGIIHLMLDDYVSGDRCLARCEQLCDSHDFTMRTIGNSATLLRVHVALSRKDQTETSSVRRFTENITGLCRQSTGFSQYISFRHNAGDLIEKVTAAPGDKTFWEACTYLPFTYA